MKKKRRSSPRAVPTGMNGTAAVSRTQLFMRRVALALALIVGIVALYYCLLPALAQNTGGNVYVYFDNGLSKYDSVQYSTDGGSTYNNMVLLSANADKCPSDMTNVNANNVYVTPTTVASGTTVLFKGTASGRVYDTVTNYRVNAASREWGYDYNNFQWTTNEGMIVSADTNCYYAPPKLMEYKYAGMAATSQNGTQSLQHFIYAHGERNADGTPIAKPEQSASIIQPNTDTNRDFWDAQYTMEGYAGHINGEYTLGNNSQVANSEGSYATGNGDNGISSDTKFYHATADFFDYYSDWELAGKTLESHTIAYGYTDAEATNSVLYTNDLETSAVVYSNNFPTDVSNHGFAAGNDASLTLGRYDYNHGTDDGTNSLFIYNNNTNPRAGLSIEMSSGKLYSASVWAWPHWTNENATMRVVLEYTNASNTTESIILAESAITYSGGWTQITTPLFALPAGATNPMLQFEVAGKQSVHIDDVSITSIDTRFSLRNGTDKVSASTNAYNGSTTSLYVDNAANAESRVEFAFNKSELSTKELYSATAYVCPTAEDDLTMTLVQFDAAGNELRSQVVGTVHAAANTWTAFTSSNFSHPLNTKRAVLRIDSANGSSFYLDDFKLVRNYFNASGSFSEGTNRISYAYQGLSWNYAISDLYEGTTSSPLYFGSNSWFTGNGRYNLADRHGRALFTQSEVESGTMFVKTDGIHDDRGTLGSGDSLFGAYLFPFDRQYLKELYGFNQDANNPYATVEEMNYPLGNSNSRGVPGLVELENGMLQLNNADESTEIEAPYFNEEFLLGDNDANAVYGKYYENVSFDFKYNEDTKYYEYDSTDYQYATRVTQNLNDGTYYMHYTNSGVTKADADDEDKNGSSQTVNQFYPFNSTATNDRFATENLMFAMKLNIPFTMFKDVNMRNDSVFKFSGDDDVWVYVDGQQVLDIGGTHTAVGGVVDLRTGYAVVGSTFDENTGEVVFDGSNTDWTNFVDGKNAIKTGVTDVEKAAFAIGTQNGIQEISSWTAFDTASFFDDTYTSYSEDYGYKTDIDEENGLYKVMYRYTDKDGNRQEGAAVFKLFQFELKDDGLGGDLQEHDLDIYYMERGLNSSNFKLAFNFVENTEREVEKEWADGYDAHNNGTDSVTVDLFRTEPVVLENQTFTFPSDYSVIRSVAYKTNGTTSENTSFAQTSDTVRVQFKPQDEAVKDAGMVLTINGMPITWEIYSQLSASAANLKILINEAEITESDFKTGSGDLATYLQMPASDERSLVKVIFNPVSTVRAGQATAEYNTWGIGDTNGWLVEAHAFNLADSTQINVAEQAIPTHSTNKTLEVSSSEGTRLLTGEDMRFIIARTTVGYNLDDDGNTHEAYGYTFHVRAVPKTDNYKLTCLVNEGSVRTVTVEQRAWTGYNSTEAFDTSKTGSYGGTTADTDDLVIELAGSENATDYQINLYAVSDKGRYYVLNGLSFADLYSTTGYSNAQYVSTVTLNQYNTPDAWKHVFDNIIESITVSGEEKNYKYFIREATINGVAVGTAKYQTEYLDKAGNVIPPTYIDYTDENGVTAPIKLYSIDNTEGHVTITNAPVTDIQLNKFWSSSALEQDVTIDIYSSYDGTNAEYVQSAVLTASNLVAENHWQREIPNLPLYKKVGETWQKLTYYAVEQKLTYMDGDEQKEYIVSYNPPSEETLNLSDGSTVKVYSFNMDVEKPTISVTNRANNSGEFVLQIKKTSALENNPLLPGVTFKLWRLTSGDAATGTYTEVAEKVTDQNGMIDFGSLPGGCTYKITEESAPLGYKVDTTPLIFTIEKDADNVLSYNETAVTHGTSYQGSTWQNETLVFSLQNETTPIIIPSTGGIGVYPIFIGGMTIVLLAFAGVLLWMKHSERPEE